jgi:hypothetical protein
VAANFPRLFDKINFQYGVSPNHADIITYAEIKVKKKNKGRCFAASIPSGSFLTRQQKGE